MLDKTSETVLKLIIELCNNNPSNDVELSNEDFKNKHITDDIINSVCFDLHEKGYIKPFYAISPFKSKAVVCLTYKGFAYFNYKKLEKRNRIKTSLFIPILVTLVTQFTVFLFKTLLPYIPTIIKFLEQSTK